MISSLTHTLRRPTDIGRMPSPRRTSGAAAAAVTLPRLPVPGLQKTLKKYLQSLVPLLQEQELHGGSPLRSALDTRARWASEFEQGIGAQCQSRLIDLDNSSPRNWLDDNIWLKKAYHEWRAPLPVNSNWWLAFFNDPSVPTDVLRGKAYTGPAGINAWQIRRAAWLIHRTLDLKDKLTRQELYPDTTRTGIWFRETTSKMFHVSRIPQIGCDTLNSPLATDSSQETRMIPVMVHDWFYAIEVYGQDGTTASPTEIEERLRRIVWDVSQRLLDGQKPVPVGLLSADARDRWAGNLQHLFSLSPKNNRIFDVITNSAFAVSLDAHTLGALPSDIAPPAIDSPKEVDNHLHNIRSSRDAHNRWFDKSYTLIVESNSRAGAMGEHSPCDALVPSMVGEYAIVQGIDEAAFATPVPGDVSTVDAGSYGWERLDWVTDNRIATEAEGAGMRAKELIADSDDSVLWFNDYGSEWIKSSARLAPDAYVQMALQLAWYKTRGTFTATYETVLTRVFDRGRTETIRTLTADSRAFVLAMSDPTASLAARHKLLSRAIMTHTTLTREAATGKGIDRHLLGLRLMLRPGEQSELFDDQLFEKSQTWKLSTSGLSAGHLFRGTGFGAPYQDGYGINYLSGPDIIKFGIESKYSCPETSTAAFQTAIAESLREMRIVCTSHMIDGEAPALAHL